MITETGKRIPSSFPLLDDELRERLETWLADTKGYLLSIEEINPGARKHLARQMAEYFEIRGLNPDNYKDFSDKDAWKLVESLTSFFIE